MYFSFSLVVLEIWSKQFVVDVWEASAVNDKLSVLLWYGWAGLSHGVVSFVLQWNSSMEKHFPSTCKTLLDVMKIYQNCVLQNYNFGFYFMAVILGVSCWG